MPRRYVAEALYREISDFLAGPKLYDLTLADQRDLEQVLRVEVWASMQRGPDVSPERAADLRGRLVLLGKVPQGTESVAAEAVARG